VPPALLLVVELLEVLPVDDGTLALVTVAAPAPAAPPPPVEVAASEGSVPCAHVASDAIVAATSAVVATRDAQIDLLFIVRRPLRRDWPAQPSGRFDAASARCVP
jgi:hypothetical protein